MILKTLIAKSILNILVSVNAINCTGTAHVETDKSDQLVKMYMAWDNYKELHATYGATLIEEMTAKQAILKYRIPECTRRIGLSDSGNGTYTSDLNWLVDSKHTIFLYSE